ncbi:MAG: ROK family protein, partial [Fimbriiglobus sp.]
KKVRKDWKGVDLDRVKSSQLAEFYHKADPVAVTVVDDAARALGAAVASVVNLLSPEVVVIGGGVSGALGESFIERIWDIAKRYTLPGAAENVRCVPAALGDDSGIVGCAAFAKAKTAARAAAA